MEKPAWTRRRILKSTVGGGLVCMSSAASAVMQLTPPQSEGPFYPRPSHRLYDQDNDLVKLENEAREAGGEILHLYGKVYSAGGTVQPGAVVEIWQCDANGRYMHPGDRSGSRERDEWFQGFGANKTNIDGEYRFRTIRPVTYPGRTPHIHVKVHLPGQPNALTTQMYVAGEPQNQRDGLYRRLSAEQQRAVTVDLQPDGAEYRGRFDIVVG